MVTVTHTKVSAIADDGAAAAAGEVLPSDWNADHTITGLTKDDVGLGNVDNTSDANKPVSIAQQAALDLKANLASPTFTGTPAAPTAAPGTNTTQIATTGFVKAAIDVILGGVSTAFDTLSEIATDLALKALAATNMTAGAGLTGGGTLAADRTFAVGAGTGITVNADDVAITTNGVSNTLLRQSSGLSVVGRSANTTGNVADITGTVGQALRVSGTTLGFGAIDLSLSAAATGVLQATSFPALTGDVTTAGGALATTIPNNTVTYAKMQDVSATSRVLGRKTAAAGDTEECTLSEVLDFVGSAAQGDILYRGAATWTRLGAGTSGQFLKTQGAAANPIWATPAGTGDVVAANNNAFTGANTFTGNTQTITGSTAFFVPLKLVSTEAGVDSGPILELLRDSASPAASDLLFQIKGEGKDSAGNVQEYASIYGFITSPTSTTESGGFALSTVQSGTTATRFSIGAGLYSASATGGDKGVDTINVPTAYHTTINGPSSDGVDIQGTNTNDSAAAGYVGEVIESDVPFGGGGVALTSTVNANITSISLTAGDWDVWGAVFFDHSAAALTALIGWINTVSATQPTVPGKGAYTAFRLTFAGDSGFPVGFRRISLSATTTVYLSVNATFGSGTCNGYGYIAARRAR